MTLEFYSSYDTFGQYLDASSKDWPIMNSNTVLHIYDCFWKEELEKIFSIKGKPGVIISDIMLNHAYMADYNIDFYGLPCWLSREKRLYSLAEFSDNIPVTEKCCNFMINKKQANRYALLKLVDIFLNIDQIHYTYSGIARNFDCTNYLTELNLPHNNDLLNIEQRAEFLSEVQTPTHFFITDDTQIDQIDTANGDGSINRVQFGGTRKTWNIIKEIFNKTSVALITESTESPLDRKEDVTVFTEKTLFPTMGLNFPIWVGGYKNAQLWTDMGFDAFDDVIDHSYQNYPTLIERCVYSVKNNLQILTDVNHASVMRKRHHDRLLKNRELILSTTLENYRDKIIASADPQHQPFLNNVKEKFNGLSWHHNGLTITLPPETIIV